MARSTTAITSFNRGLVSRLGLARTDVKRVQMSAEEMTNFLPRVLGSMSIRPGWKYLGGMQGHNPAKLIPFVFAVDDTAIIEITNGVMRIWRVDELIERVTVGTGITNGTFTTDLTGWTDNDEAGATSEWLGGGYMSLLGTGTNAAIRDQTVTVAGGDVNLAHGLRVTIARGPVLIRVGSSAGAEDYIRELSLGTGVHSLEFTPAGNFNIRLFSRESYPVLVDSVAIESAGVLTITAPWDADDLDNLRWDQSGDIVFVACEDKQQRMIMRWSPTSWSIAVYEPLDGPFRTENTTEITIASSNITGAVTLTASKSIFKSDHVGALFSITSEGQTVTESISAQNTFTDPIRITGVDSSRVFTIILSGTWSATVTLQRSLDSEGGPWEDVSGSTWSANTTETFDDGLDNQIAWYRIGVKTGQYTSGTVVATLDYALGAITGVVKITSYTSGTSVVGVVVRDLGGMDATAVWAEGVWSDFRGWPTAVALHEGRLWWAGKGKVWGSITDAFDSFDPDVEGDSGAISRTLGVGPVDRINWLFSSQRLLIGADINEYAARSSSLDEPLTPTAFNIKVTSSQGSAKVTPGRIDSVPAFVNRTGMKVFQNEIAGNTFDYSAKDLCHMVPEIGDPQIVRLAVQRQPDTRIHAVRSDGTVALAVFDQAEDVLGWCEIETDGEVEDAIVLPAQPGVQDDYVYYVVKRTIDDEEVRYLEKWAQASTTIGGVGLAGDEIPFLAFTGFEASSVDASTSGILFFYGADVGTFYTLGPVSTNMYSHTDDPFPASGTLLDPSMEEFQGVASSGCQTKEGRYIIISGDEPVTEPVIFDTQDGSFVTLSALPFAGECVAVAARESPQFEVIFKAGGTYRLYRPNITTGALGSSVWEVVSVSLVVARQWVWDDDGNVWTVGTNAGGLIQLDFDTGSFAVHTYPTDCGSGQMGAPTYDENNNKLYVSLGHDPGGVNPPTESERLYEYSGWDATPTANSGTYTIIDENLQSEHFGRYQYYDAATDTLFHVAVLSTFGSSGTVSRYTGDPKVLVDEVEFISDDDPEVDVYGYAATGFAVFYKEGTGYLVGNNDGTEYLIKLVYAGADILEDSEGNPLVAGGVTGRLHNLADSYLNFDTAGPTVTGLDHLEGKEVVVWANGVDLGTDDAVDPDEDYAQTYMVTGGALDPALDAEYSAVTIGLPYTARYKSSKLAINTQLEMMFGRTKRVTTISFVLADTHAKGIRFGPDFSSLDDRPLREGWATVDPDEITTAYDEEEIAFNSDWATDLRVCLQANAPRPCTVLAVKLDLEV